jgi:hypothetical protein
VGYFATRFFCAAVIDRISITLQMNDGDGPVWCMVVSRLGVVLLDWGLGDDERHQFPAKNKPAGSWRFFGVKHRNRNTSRSGNQVPEFNYCSAVLVWSLKISLFPSWKASAVLDVKIYVGFDIFGVAQEG